MSGVRFLVIECCDDYEQVLGLMVGKQLPPGGVLTWPSESKRHAFGTRADARAAIDRTEHFRLAFGLEDYPERKFCKVVPVSVP
jgi:hypothetical protein